MRAVIMAGGKGTRLQQVTRDIPKPMINVAGKPIIEYQIASLRNSGIVDITIIIGYLGEVIKQHFGDGSQWGVSIDYIIENEPLGTAGALIYLKGKITDDFFLAFGDLMLDIDWQRFMAYHKSCDALITLFGHPNSHSFDSDLVLTDEESKVIGFDSKSNTRDYYYHNFVNAGLYCISLRVLDAFTAPTKTDLENDVIKELIPSGKVYAYRSSEYVKDMGTPERLNAVSKDVANGIVGKRCLRNEQKCVFLDRDGTVNELRRFISSPDGFELLPGVAEAIRQLNGSEYLAILTTNQPVVARGECTFQGLDEIHMKMETLLGKNGAYLDDIYFCPHHPDSGFNGEVPELKYDCECRKPKTGMLDSAVEEHNINLSDSWYIGDTTRDIQTGINAGLKTILVQTGEAGKEGQFEVTPDFIAEDLLSAVQIIMRSEKNK